MGADSLMVEAGTEAHERAVEQVLLAEREWLLAHLGLDARALNRLMAPEYAQIDDKGRTTSKEKVLASLRSGERGAQRRA